ncbi:suppressor of cytokine signaling 1a [Hoplias malabaricus]|uniref:suppressor of cytokine signaling 1a n=1 Tax=Hoplias malabaricus TaxID=27720 RepID=UPI0034620C18
MVAHSAVEETSGTAERRAQRQRGVLAEAQNSPPTHFRSFRSEKEYRIIVQTSCMLEQSGFYWGAMTVEEAHERLKKEPEGTFLIRDSRQKDVFFTLSYCASSGPVSIRILFRNSRFSLYGSKDSFESLFKLLVHYKTSPKKSLVRPYRKDAVPSLQHLCRQSFMTSCMDSSELEAIENPFVKDFLQAFPYPL